MKINKSFRDWLESLIYAGIIVFVLYFLFWPFKVEGNSMENNFYSGDRIIVSRITTLFYNFSYGDIVVCNVDINGKDEFIVKRIIGKPGDHVQIVDEKVFLNDSVLIEPYLDNNITTGDIDIILESDEYFVLGDNRELSLDSRQLGTIKHNFLVGKVILKWYPLNSIEIY